MKLRPCKKDNGELWGWSFFCPGCDHAHVYFMTGPTTWEFNGDQDKPTFTPSLKNTCAPHPDPKQRCCHIQVTAGRIRYYDDCTHDLKGQTIDMVEWPYPMGEQR